MASAALLVRFLLSPLPTVALTPWPTTASHRLDQRSWPAPSSRQQLSSVPATPRPPPACSPPSHHVHLLRLGLLRPVALLRTMCISSASASSSFSLLPFPRPSCSLAAPAASLPSFFSALPRCPSSCLLLARTASSLALAPPSSEPPLRHGLLHAAPFIALFLASASSLLPSSCLLVLPSPHPGCLSCFAALLLLPHAITAPSLSLSLSVFSFSFSPPLLASTLSFLALPHLLLFPLLLPAPTPSQALIYFFLLSLLLPHASLCLLPAPMLPATLSSIPSSPHAHLPLLLFHASYPSFFFLCPIFCHIHTRTTTSCQP